MPILNTFYLWKSHQMRGQNHDVSTMTPGSLEHPRHLHKGNTFQDTCGGYLRKGSAHVEPVRCRKERDVSPTLTVWCNILAFKYKYTWKVSVFRDTALWRRHALALWKGVPYGVNLGWPPKSPDRSQSFNGPRPCEQSHDRGAKFDDARSYD